MTVVSEPTKGVSRIQANSNNYHFYMLKMPFTSRLRDSFLWLPSVSIDRPMAVPPIPRDTTFFLNVIGAFV